MSTNGQAKEIEYISQNQRFHSENTTTSKESIQPSEIAQENQDRLKKLDKKQTKDLQTTSMQITSKPNPFKFFEDPDGYEEEKRKQAQGMDLFGTNAGTLPLNIGERLDISDLSKAKYMNPTKRRKMSYSDFENRMEDSNFTLLDLLVMCKGDKTILEYLEQQMSHVFEITKTFEDGRGFLYYAIKRNFKDVVVSMLDLSKDILSSTDKWGKTPLHYACSFGHLDIMKILVASQADVNVQDNSGQTPLHLAMMNRHLDICRVLISFECQLNLENIYGLTPLDYLPQSLGHEFKNFGCLHGSSGCLERSDGANSDSMFKRRFELLRRKGKIKPTNVKTSFSDCYTERDKGKQDKRAIGGARIVEDTQTEVEGQDEAKVRTAESQEQANEKVKSITAYGTLENPQYSNSTPTHPRTFTLDPVIQPLIPFIESRTKTEIPQTQSAENMVTHKDFTLIDVIGSGSFGEVYLVSSKKDNKYFAMKVYSKHKIIRNGLLKFLFLEKRILLNFDHPFIVKVYATFQTPRKLYLVMDYCRFKDLGQYLTKNEKLPEHQTRLLMAEIVLAVEELHRRNIIHRDLKPDNILIGEDGHIKITDFGLSKDNISKKKLTGTFCGSIAYLPPEVVKRVGHGQAADWYLVGELLYECLFGVPPFFNTSKKILLASILQDEVKFPSYINRCTKDLILRLMDKNTETRLGSKEDAREVKNHPFFTGIDWEAVYLKKNRLFDTSDITPYQPLHYNQDIVDNMDLKGGNSKVQNWSVYR